MQNKSKGFTLIELLVVIAIIAILASLIVINLNTRRQASATNALQKTAEQIVTSSNLYHDDHPQAISVSIDSLVPDYMTTLADNEEVVGGIVSLVNGTSTFELIGNGGPADGCIVRVVGSVVPALEEIRSTCSQ